VADGDDVGTSVGLDDGAREGRPVGVLVGTNVTALTRAPAVLYVMPLTVTRMGCSTVMPPATEKASTRLIEPSRNMTTAISDPLSALVECTLPKETAGS